MDVLKGLERVSQRAEHHVEVANAPRRSSVAIIVRVPELQARSVRSIEELLAKCPWSSNIFNHAEMLFIKRAASERDRWSSHIAVPGGRRDPDDASDLAAAVREVREEVGLDLTTDAVYVGPLDQRPVKVSFGSRAIMTLCPFVFLMTTPNAEVDLQPTEVSTAFWHPMRDLLDPKYATYESVHVRDRMSYRYLPAWLNQCVKLSVGELLFGAIELNPRELLHAKPDTNLADPPYRLWGLTLGFLTDFFELCQPGCASSMIKLPTARAWDMRAIIWVLSRPYMLAKQRELRALSKRGDYSAGKMDVVTKMLDDWFPYLSGGITSGLVLRLAVLLTLCYKLVSKLNRAW